MVVKYPGVEEVFEEITDNIGMAGMFVCGETPMPPGTLMHFELRPAENWRVLRGRGRIVWVQKHSTPHQQTGMGIRFIELEERARRGIRWLVETYQEDETRSFENWTVPEQFARGYPERDEPDGLATQEIPPLHLEERRRPLLAVVGALATVALLGWLGWGLLRSKSPGAASEEPAQLAETAASTQPIEASEANDATTSPPAAAETPEGEDGTDIRDATPIDEPVAEPPPAQPPVAPSVARALTARADAWAAAWASQDTDRYLAFYAPDFRPADDSSHDDWVAQRRQRLTRPAFIKLVVEDIQVLDEGTGSPSTVFSQSYTSNTFEDTVTKSLTWHRIDDRWLIVAERSAP